MAKRKGKRRRTTSEKIFLALSILIALSMILSLFVGFAASRDTGGAPLPIETVAGTAAIFISFAR
jgi:hypothetical protein